MTTKADVWSGEFGDEYLKRNPVSEETINARTLLFSNMFHHMTVTGHEYPKTILEVGCGNGANLITLHNMFQTAPDEVQRPELYGIDVNKNSVKEARKNLPGATIFQGDADKIEVPDYSMDLVITSGFLIHVHPDELLKIMHEINRINSKYIFCMEYFAPETREIKYRNKEELLWANDFGTIWLDEFKYQCFGYGFAWKRVSNLDNLTWWMLKKTN